MQSSQIVLPYFVEDTMSGLAEVQGMMQASEYALLLEYQMKDSILGVIKSKTKRLEIPFEDLLEARFKSSFWGNKFRLRVRRMDLLGKIPHAGKDGYIEVKVHRRNRPIARQLEKWLRQRLGNDTVGLPGGREPKPFFD